MRVLIRPALAEDVAAMGDIGVRASNFPWTLSQLQQSTDADAGGDRGLLIECESEVAGFVIFDLVLDEGSIHNIAIHPNHQRRGLASKLLSHTIKLMKQENVERCLLEVRRSNVAAAAFYTGQGFQVDGVRKNYYRCSVGREDALLMSKLL